MKVQACFFRPTYDPTLMCAFVFVQLMVPFAALADVHMQMWCRLHVSQLKAGALMSEHLL